MGQLFSKLVYVLFGTREVRVLLLGLDNAGKTTILYKLLEPDSSLKHTPTVGFNLETLKVHGLKMQCWDLGGQDSIRPYWRSYFFNQEAIVFVVDSTDKGRMLTAKQELHAILTEPELQGAVLLVLANKQDVPDAARVSEVSERLGLADLERTWTIMGTSAERGEGLQEAFAWLAQRLK
jgi:ADP-ribosylation factor-like protein 1